jgi:hypothetical protein
MSAELPPEELIAMADLTSKRHNYHLPGPAL